MEVYASKDDELGRWAKLDIPTHPYCPIVCKKPSETKGWLMSELANKRIRKPERLAYRDKIKQQWNEYNRAIPKLNILNECLKDLLIEKYEKVYKHQPTSVPEIYLYKESNA